MCPLVELVKKMKCMKNQSLPMPSWKKMYVAYPAAKTSNAAIKPAPKEAETIENEPVSLPDFQRKAFVGNYFAGPHCLFDPKLFK